MSPLRIKITWVRLILNNRKSILRCKELNEYLDGRWWDKSPPSQRCLADSIYISHIVTEIRNKLRDEGSSVEYWPMQVLYLWASNISWWNGRQPCCKHPSDKFKKMSKFIESTDKSRASNRGKTRSVRVFSYDLGIKDT